MERFVVLKPNQIHRLSQGGLITCITGKIRLVRKHSNIVYLFETLSPNHEKDRVKLSQDITDDYVINTNSTISTVSIEV